MNRTLNASPGKPLSAARWGIALVAALACLANSAQAAISVPTASPLTLDTAPAATEWSTLDITPGNAGTFNDATTLDAAVVTNAAAAITTVLPTSPTVPPSANRVFRYNTTSLNIQSRVTGAPYSVLLATLQNDSGSDATSLTISYDMGSGQPNPEQVPGLRVFYSLSGAANSWTQIPELTTGTAGPLTATVVLGGWSAGTTMYLLWAEDNADPGTDGEWTIDNVSLTVTGGPVTPRLGITAPANGANINQSATFNFTAGAVGMSSVQFLVDNVSQGSISAPGPYVIPLTGLSIGTHLLTAVGTLTAGGTFNATNNPVTINIVANTGPSITITNPPTGFSTLVGTAITNLVTATDDVAVVKVEWYVAGNLALTRSNANWSFVYNNSLAGTYTIQAIAYDVVGLTASSSIDVTVTNPAAPFVVGLPNGSEWSYYFTSNSPPTGPPEWFGAGYNWDSWSNGFGELGGGDAANFYPERTVIDIGPTGNRYTAAYFVTTLNLPEDPAAYDDYSLRFRLLCDDGAVVYFNGQEVFRHTMAAGTVQYGTLASGGTYHDGTVYTNFDIPRALLKDLAQFDNVVAVEVHQESITSSDISFDMMVWGQPYSRPTIAISSPTNGARVLQANDLVVNVNASTFVQYVDFFYDNVSLGNDATRDPGQPNFSLIIPAATINSTGPHTITVIGTDGNINTATNSVVVNVFYAGDTIIPAGSTWRYLDDGSDQGTAWTAINFDDLAWKSGAAELGYGDGDEATVVLRTNVVSGTTNITFYFRKEFNVANPAAVSNVTLRVERDDGAVVYLNGTEVHRGNMPAGAITYTTFASAAIEDVIDTNCVSSGLLVPGKNVVAAEIHQASLTSSDVSFNLALILNAPTDVPTVTITSPTNGQVLLAGSVTVTNIASDPDCAVTLVEVFVDDVLIGSDTTAPYTVTWNATAGAHTLKAQVTDSTGNKVFSAPVNVTVLPGPDSLIVVQTNSSWKYLDDGSDQGTGWQASAFDDGAWPSGPAELGFGDGDEATVVRQASTITGTNIITYYFRHGFNSPAPSSMTNLIVRLRRDDGGIVYLNGAEVFRSNMPTGAVNYLTFAAANTTSETAFFETNISPAVLQSGPNVVAVEVHQNNYTSTDVSFELQLEAQGPPGSFAKLQIALVDVGGTLVPELRWSDASFVLIQSSDPTAPLSTWTVVAGAVSGYRPPVTTGATRYYALRKP